MLRSAPRSDLRLRHDPRHPRRGTVTLAAATMALAVSAVPLALAVEAALVATGRASGEAFRQAAVDANLAIGASQVWVAQGIVALVLGAVGLVGVGLAVGVAARHAGGREAAIGVFGMGGPFVIVISTVGLLSDPPSPGSGQGVLAGLVVLAVAVLLLLPACARDFDRALLARELVRRDRHRVAARRQGPG